jgi:hypothetical protein
MIADLDDVIRKPLDGRRTSECCQRSTGIKRIGAEGEAPAVADSAWAGLTSRAVPRLQVVANKRCSRHAR